LIVDKRDCQKEDAKNDCRNAQYLLRIELLMKTNWLEILELGGIAYILVLAVIKR
jgi:hypothetical protein